MADDVSSLIKRAADLFGGSETKLAAAACCSQNTIWAARRANRISAELAVKIEAATDGAVARWEFRPDLWDAPSSDVEAA